RRLSGLSRKLRTPRRTAAGTGTAWLARRRGCAWETRSSGKRLGVKRDDPQPRARFLDRSLPAESLLDLLFEAFDGFLDGHPALEERVDLLAEDHGGLGLREPVPVGRVQDLLGDDVPSEEGLGRAQPLG